jgi:pimeloyl-ACP methyl ester carboxylesterase
VRTQLPKPAAEHPIGGAVRSLPTGASNGAKRTKRLAEDLVKVIAVAILALTLVAGCDRQTGESAREQPAAATEGCASEAIPPGFASDTAVVNGTTLHFVSGGTGPALILVHGFPQNWSAWAEVMPRLAERFRVVAVDLRGIGGSTPTAGGYDAATMAEDVYQLSRSLGLDRPYVVGSDFGGWVAYALARLHPNALRGAMIMDVPLPGIEPWDQVETDPALWHFGFHRAPGLAEQLLAGREAIYIGHFLRTSVADPRSISDEDVRRYACALSSPGQMAAAMGMYRAFDADERFGQEQRGPLDVPIVLVAGDSSFGTLLPDMVSGLRGVGVRSVTSETIAQGGHYLADERPAEVTALIERHA